MHCTRLALCALAVASASSSARAQLAPQKVWISIDDPGNVEPGGGGSWVDVAQPYTLGGGEWVWIGIGNEANADKDKGCLLKISGDHNGVYADEWRSHAADGSRMQTLTGGGIAVPEDDPNSKVWGKVFHPQPAWEVIKIKNHTLGNRTFWADVDTWCGQRDERLDYDDLLEHFRNFNFGAAQAMAVDIRINEFRVFPTLALIDPAQGLVITAAVETGPWVGELVSQTPHGAERSGVRFSTTGPGLSVTDQFDFSFGTTLHSHSFDVYAYDTVTAQWRRYWFGVEVGKGDVNCDGVTDFFDIDPFLVLLFGAAPAHQCVAGIEAADADESGVVDFFDIDAFLAVLFGG